MSLRQTLNSAHIMSKVRTSTNMAKEHTKRERGMNSSGLSKEWKCVCYKKSEGRLSLKTTKLEKYCKEAPDIYHKGNVFKLSLNMKHKLINQ